MCGICGFLSDKAIDDNIIKRMTDSMYHRGPDFQDTCYLEQRLNQYGAFGHCRLSILDLSEKGNQPMWSKDGRYCIVYNGEIYNHLKIRKRLELSHVQFHSYSDTETLLYSYIQWGKECLNEISGMFAFAIYDKQTGELFLARDRFGKKPLYYYKKGNIFIFASELKPIFIFPEIDKSINTKALAYYLNFGYFPHSNTSLQYVSKLPPASFLINREGRIEVDQYWSVVKEAHKAERKIIMDFGVAKNTLKEELRKVTAERLISDVPVGVFLSGGIDSALVAALAQKVSKEPVNTYTIGFFEKDYDEADVAKKIAKHIGAIHHEHYLSQKDLEEIVDCIPYYFDEPFGNTTLLPTMVLSKFARQDITVALSGDGGDEIFGGYPQYAWVKIAQRMDIPGEILYKMLPGYVIERLPQRMRRVIENRDKKISSQMVLRKSVEFYEKFLSCEHDAPYYSVEEDMNIDDWQFRRMLLDMQTSLPGDMLHRLDRASMYASLEVRSPLLDHRVAELTFRMPQKFKIKGSIQKYILKEIAYEYIPKTILDLPKRGFVIPYESWMRTRLKEKLLYFAGNEYISEQGLFNAKMCEEIVQDFLKGNNKNANFIWNLLTYQLWYERYVCSDKVA
ncbi:asparagine synthase (glutamine-hydrolyzing) [bacterium D16-54]|nr:asparagine synthase (glutamine-hydrolyzing) [bacterium D16-54]RKJ14067.1 asparagine synthase (glutamine-hydrolyzing) [bacterium D16-56]